MTGLSVGACMANREFDCILCERHFSRMTADFIFLEQQICDECLEELWQLNEEARRERVSRQLAKRGLQDEDFKNRMLEVIPMHVAPVVPHPIYRLTFVSLMGITWRLGLVGISYRWEWYTGVVVLTLIVLGIALGLFLMGRLKRSLATAKDDSSKPGGRNGAVE